LKEESHRGRSDRNRQAGKLARLEIACFELAKTLGAIFGKICRHWDRMAATVSVR